MLPLQLARASLAAAGWALTACMLRSLACCPCAAGQRAGRRNRSLAVPLCAAPAAPAHLCAVPAAPAQLQVMKLVGSRPDVLLLAINFDENKAVVKALGVKVGAAGVRVCAQMGCRPFVGHHVLTAVQLAAGTCCLRAYPSLHLTCTVTMRTQASVYATATLATLQLLLPARLHKAPTTSPAGAALFHVLPRSPGETGGVLRILQAHPPHPVSASLGACCCCCLPPRCRCHVLLLPLSCAAAAAAAAARLGMVWRPPAALASSVELNVRGILSNTRAAPAAAAAAWVGVPPQSAPVVPPA